MAEETAKQMIERGEWANCWICEKVFKRKRETKRYCHNHNCERGFCEGEHGSFSQNRGLCIVCGATIEDKQR